MPESIHKQPQDFRLADARKHYEENIENLCFPEIYLKPIIQTKGSSYFHNLEQTPLWDRFHFSENGWSYIYEIPILYNIPLNASIGFITREGRMIKQDKEVRLQTNLIIQKYKVSGNVHIFLSTIIGYIPNPYKEIQGGSPWLWTGDRRNFTGYQFFTNADGSFKGAFQYRNSHRISITLSIYDKDREYTYPQEAFILNLGSVGTKSQDQYCWECRMPMSDEDTYCPSCGAGPETLPPAIVIEKVTCEQCDLLLSNCICGNGGGNNGDDGDRCPDCLSSECSGECQEIRGGGTGGGEETLPGGNQEEDGENSSVKYVSIKGLYIDSLLLDNRMTRTREILQQLESDCMASELMSAIFGTKVIGTDTLGNDVAKFDPNTGTIKINIEMWQQDINILEEMIHALQKKIGVKGQPNNLFNMEVEAKIALFRYLKKCGKTSLMPVGYHVQWDSLVSKYIETGSIEDYDAIATYFRTESQNSGYTYGDTEKYQEMEGYKNIDNTRNLFNCDDYNNYN